MLSWSESHGQQMQGRDSIRSSSALHSSLDVLLVCGGCIFASRGGSTRGELCVVMVATPFLLRETSGYFAVVPLLVLPLKPSAFSVEDSKSLGGLFHSHIHLRLINVFKKYYTVSNICG